MKIIAVTSCATGIAHTYMAAEAIKKICKEKNFDCKVETQGALGVENELSMGDIQQADLIIFGNDVKIKNVDRFKGFESKIKSIKPHDIVKNAKIIFEEGENYESNKG